MPSKVSGTQRGILKVSETQQKNFYADSMGLGNKATQRESLDCQVDKIICPAIAHQFLFLPIPVFSERAHEQSGLMVKVTELKSLDILSRSLTWLVLPSCQQPRFSLAESNIESVACNHSLGDLLLNCQ